VAIRAVIAALADAEIVVARSRSRGGLSVVLGLSSVERDACRHDRDDLDGLRS
jgi:hypothetical protein